MIRNDPVQELQDVYAMWSQFKQSVVDWFQTNGWLIELGIVVGFFVVCFVGFLLFVWVFSISDQAERK
jgi:hypothetical protein